MTVDDKRPTAAGQSGEPLVALRGVDFAYDERPVLRRIGFELRPGDFTGIVGPNGSGKSTLVDLVDGILQPTSGEVLVRGRRTDRYRRRDMAREVALVPQHFDLDFDLAVREVVEMGSYCRGKDAASCGDPEQMLARLGIADLAGRRFSELSGGEKQLVVLAQALMQQAPLLLLDEPASALDVSHQLRLFDLLKELNADGLTVLCILHDLNLALHYFDKLLVLSDGEVAAFGPPDDVLRPEVVEAVYGVRAYLHRHAGRTYLTFSPRLRGERRGRVHLVCGGGTGAGMMRELVDAGYEVTAGVLNALDTDEETGDELGLRMAVEAPFTPIGDAAHAENLELMHAADLVVVSAVPVSHGNARNIDAARDALRSGIPVWADEGVCVNDFAGVTGALAEDGARFFAGEEELLAAVRGRSFGDGRASAPGAAAGQATGPKDGPPGAAG
ncbi:MAG: ABC transporter ATP-binding protein [Actinobacteria bacterium]|nr:ABC transporter ATP-binding protein [Actinomycetota bacterium]